MLIETIRSSQTQLSPSRFIVHLKEKNKTMLAMEFEETMGNLDKKIQSIKEEGKPMLATSPIPLTPETGSVFKHSIEG